MDDEEEVSYVLRYGTKQEIGKVLTVLSHIKDPRYTNELKEIINSGDPILSVMASYVLGETGDSSAIQHLYQTIHNTAGQLFPATKIFDFSTLEEILKLPDEINNAFNFYNSSYFEASKEKLLKILNIYSSDMPKMNISYFDDLVVFFVSKTRGMILDALAVCEFSLGNIDDALKYSMEAVSIAQEAGDPQLLKIVYADLGHIHMALGNYYSALELLHKSLEVDEGSYDPWRKKNRILSNLSQLYYLVGQYDKAMEYTQEALELSNKENDLYGTARGLNAKGVILCSLNEFRDAEGCLLEAVRLSVNKLNDKTFQGLVLNNLSFIYHSLSEIEKAKSCLKDALELSVQMSARSTESLINSSMAILELECGNVDNAERNAEAALHISTEIYDISGQADANFIL
ncbi:MAG: tetratricopeptide repeat protein, partial [Nitrospira sp.]|nr:tetratricopeptide repeat protein [Nitrospira sp.]